MKSSGIQVILLLMTLQGGLAHVTYQQQHSMVVLPPATGYLPPPSPPAAISYSRMAGPTMTRGRVTLHPAAQHHTHASWLAASPSWRLFFTHPLTVVHHHVIHPHTTTSRPNSSTIAPTTPQEHQPPLREETTERRSTTTEASVVTSAGAVEEIATSAAPRRSADRSSEVTWSRDQSHDEGSSSEETDDFPVFQGY